MVQATLASIKHYCPDAPICLIVDGDVDVSDLESEYGVWTMRISEMDSDEMRELVQGSTRTKLAAMWEGPFEHFVWMDSDAILWGDIRPRIRMDIDYQIFWNEVSIPADADEAPSWLAHFYFDLEKLKDFDPHFEWRGHPYFCDGVYACRRNAIPFSKWKQALGWRQEENNPWSKGFNCMPMMNYLVHSMAGRGELKVEWTDLQWVRSRDNIGLVEDCKRSKWRFPNEVNKPMVLHFCGRKPYTFDRNCYSRPFTIARLDHKRRERSKLGSWMAVFIEDGRVLCGKIISKLRRSVSEG